MPCKFDCYIFCMQLRQYFALQPEAKYLPRLNVTKLAAEIFTSIVTSYHS